MNNKKYLKNYGRRSQRQNIFTFTTKFLVKVHYFFLKDSDASECNKSDYLALLLPG